MICSRGCFVLRAAEAPQQLDLLEIDLIDRRQAIVEARLIGLEALAERRRARHLQDHGARELMLGRDLREDLLAHRDILDETRIFAGDLEIDQHQRLLDLVEHEAEEA